jgi:crotonobetainyl-CoA:carnitine CoA-transferase CaiB-like acyl-CoA transferase
VEALGAVLDGAGVPNAPLLNVDQVAGHPQTEALGMIAACGNDELGLVGIPLSFGAERPRSERRAPGLGEHNALLKK